MFILGHIEARKMEQFQLLLDYVGEVYQNNKEDFNAKIAEKNRQQRERNARRIAREKEEKIKCI